MADNIDVTPGTGKTVAAEEVGAVIYQQVKLIDATATGTAPTGVAAKPLQVSLANHGANAIAVKVDGSAVTQPVSGTVTALSGTAANLKAEITIAAAQTLATVTTVSTVTNVATIGTSIVPGVGATHLGKAEDAAHTSGDTGVMALVVRNDTPGALATTDGDYSPLQVNAGGGLRVDGSAVTQPVSGTVTAVSATAANLKAEVVGTGTFVAQVTLAAGAASIGKAEDVASAGGDVGVPAMAIQLATPADTAADGDYAMLQMSAGRLWVDASGKTLTVASHAVTNAGTFAVQVDGAALTSLQLIDDVIIADDAAFAPGSTKVAMAGFQADESSTDSVDEGDAGAARMTLDRKVIVTAQPHTAGGCLIANMTSGDSFTALTNTAQAIKASAGQLYGWYIYNPNAAATYVIIYNTAAASVTVGTTNPVMVLCIPPTSAANILSAVGIEFTNAGFSAAATTTGGGNTAPSTALEANFFYK